MEDTFFPFNQNLLSSLNEPILFVDHSGRLLAGTNAAYKLIGCNKENVLANLNDYFDFEKLQAAVNRTCILPLKRTHATFLEAKCVFLKEDTYGIVLKPLELPGGGTFHIKDTVNESEGLLILAGDQILDCNESFATIFQYSRTQLKSIRLGELLQLNKGTIVAEWWKGTESGILAGKKRNGSPVYIQVLDYSSYHGKEDARIFLIKNVTDQVKNEKRIEYMAYYDELTDLPNRNFFMKILDEAINKSKKLGEEQLAVYFLDIDYFKEINETLGYSFGDKLLKAISDKLKSFLGPDTFIARIGGDEFLLLQNGIKAKENTVKLAEDLIVEFESPVKIGEHDIYTSISIGISVYPNNGKSPEALLTHAQSAMHVIKEKHRNNYKMFETSISENFKSMLTMESDLRKAIQKEQFELHYQPQKNLLTGGIVGMEALLRWNHPEKGYIPPLDFISLAERTGLIIEIGDWVMYEACRQNKLLQGKGYDPVIVSVNLSAKQFHQKNLVTKIKNTLKETGLDPKYLELEITESMAMTNEHYILNTLQQLRDLGVLVSIDDFGTGYSSLRYLSVFPVTKLKIDKTFMDASQKQNKAIVKSIIHMSHSLNMKVIAEGVETHEQIEFLMEEKCDEMQGYYFSKPLPPAKLVQLLTAG
ncbi:putative bifunctional diguanylate cyclase/phosphodiesterase [Oceanobacillus picturae]|uniref:putative bifunctional diguanylate cyclase/phosphodiesterase n=1 Tax=Oceanobacillus picturae TaxID=171693 RepID=UPI000E6A1CBF|nr:EAL domain-containing protein [Oceanobacillus picturae]RIU96534.1 EAL domain-containing protein [Oceanobacillus picturae]